MVGFLDRVIGAVNKVGTPIDSLTDTIGPSRYKKGQDLEDGGRSVPGRIAGIERKLDSGDDTELFALEFTGTDGPVLAGTRIRARGMERLRLGMPVLLRVDDDGRAVLDWQALCARWGIGFAEPAQRPLRSAPDPGVSDTALDMRVQKHLKKWTPARAKLMSFQRRTMFGGVATQNWDVDLQLADGTTTRAGGELVPFYASWLAVPGADVPIVFDPNDPGKASVDWPAAANEAAERAGALDDAPPAGSIAGPSSTTAAPRRRPPCRPPRPTRPRTQTWRRSRASASRPGRRSRWASVATASRPPTMTPTPSATAFPPAAGQRSGRPGTRG